MAGTGLAEPKASDWITVAAGHVEHAVAAASADELTAPAAGAAELNASYRFAVALQGG